MTSIRLYEHPLAVVEPQLFEAESLALWLFEHYGETPSVQVQIFAGEPSAETEITNNVSAILRGDASEYVILQSPGGALAVIPMWVWFVAAVVVSLALVPSPVMPSNVNRTQTSPNNALGSRENKVRILERVEDIYGTVKSIPSLMMPTYNKYKAHKKYEYGYYCVGRGYYGITDIKDGNTLISDINGASASVYDPFTSPNSGHSPILQIGGAIVDNVLTVSRSIEVDGLTLKAANQVQLEPTASYAFSASAGTITQAPASAGFGNLISAHPASAPNVNSVISVGNTITVAMEPFNIMEFSPASLVNAEPSDNSYNDADGSAFAHVAVGNTITVSGFSNAANNGTFTITGKPTPEKIIVSGALLISETTDGVLIGKVVSVVDYSGNYTVTAVADRVITVASPGWTQNISGVLASISVDGVSYITDWITLPEIDRTEVWCNVIAPNGMFKDNGGKSTASVSFTIDIQRLDPTTLAPMSDFETVTGMLSGSVTEERAETIEHATGWTGPARVRMARTTPYDYNWEGTVQDEIKWADLYSVSPFSKTEFGNKTTIHTITQATARATAVKSRQLNCIASRKLPIYDGSTFSGAFDSTGRFISGSISTTSKLCNIIAAVSIDPKIGARDLATEVDMAQIWAVQQQLDLWSTECGQFNYTFDSDNTSFEETLVMIANAGFCIAYRQNGKIRLSFDKAQTSSTALFTHRNKKPASETITRKFASDSDYDGVEFIYVDPDSNLSETITLPLSGAYTKLKKFEIAGIRSFDQAWLRANREYNKLVGQRLTLETVTTLDARSLLPNSRIDVVDNTRFKSYDGEVIGQSGLELTLSQAVAFTPALSHSIVLMRRDGSLQSIPVTVGSAPNKVILQSLPSEAITTQYGPDGIRTIYSFAADAARGAMAWMVQEIDLSDGKYATIRAINYSANYYAADTLAIPNRDSVIN